MVGPHYIKYMSIYVVTPCSLDIYCVYNCMQDSRNAVQLELTQHCKAIILQLKVNK